MHHLRLLSISLLLITISSNLHALPGDKDKPIELAADSVDVDEAMGISTYKGDVDLRQGSMRLQASKITVKQAGKKPNQITAFGSPVKFEQKSEKGQIKARAKRIEYAVNSETLQLIGDASLSQAGDTIKSDRITYDRVNHKMKAGAAAKGKQRVKITIQAPK